MEKLARGLRAWSSWSAGIGLNSDYPPCRNSLAPSMRVCPTKETIKSQLSVWTDKETQAQPEASAHEDSEKPFEAQSPAKQGEEADWRRVSSMVARGHSLASRLNSINKRRTTQGTFWSGMFTTGRAGQNLRTQSTYSRWFSNGAPKLLD